MLEFFGHIYYILFKYVAVIIWLVKTIKWSINNKFMNKGIIILKGYYVYTLK